MNSIDHVAKVIAHSCEHCSETIMVYDTDYDIYGNLLHLGCSDNVIVRQRCFVCYHLYGVKDDGSPVRDLCTLCYAQRITVCGGSCKQKLDKYKVDKDGFDCAVQCRDCNEYFHYCCTNFCENEYGRIICQRCLLGQSYQCTVCDLVGTDVHTQAMVMCVKCRKEPLHPECAIQGCCTQCVKQ